MPTPQRLPIVNNDDGVWGDIIRQFLMKEHVNDDTDNAANGGHKTITVQAGTATAGTAPLKFTSGTLLSTPEAGAIEFNTDTLYFTQTTGATRKKIAAYDDSSGATGDVYYRDSSGNFTRLGIGSSGDVLTVSGGLPSWSPGVSGSSYVAKTGDTMSGNLVMSNTATGGIAFYNTTDQVTNYERVRLLFSSNQFLLRTEAGGTGTIRNIQFTTTGGRSITISDSGSGVAGFININNTTSGTTAFLGVDGTLNAASGTQLGVNIAPTINGSGTQGYTILKVNPTQTAAGSGTKLLADFQLGGSSKTVIDTSGNIGILATSSVPTHSFTLGSTSTGTAAYNTSDQTTNYERVRAAWLSNNYYHGFEWGGSGTTRKFNVGIASGAGTTLNLGNGRFLSFSSTTPFFNFNIGSTGLTGNLVDFSGNTIAGSSGTQTALAINPTINQSSTAAYTMLHINPSETATGSGTKNLILAQVGGSDRFIVNNAGNTTISGDIVVNTSRLTTATNGTNIGVGIGTTSPSSASANRTVLHIADTSGNGSEIRLNSTSVQARLFNNNSEFGFGTDNNYAIRFFINGGGNTALKLATTLDATLYGKLLFGSAEDTNLYRSAADTLKTDDNFEVTGTISASNLSGTNTGDQVISDATITTSDITTNNVSTSKHGFAPKAPNDATKFLDGTGAWSTPGSLLPASTKTTSYTIVGTDVVILADASSGTLTVTLPAAASFSNYRFYVKRIDSSSNTCTVARTGSDTIDGATSMDIDPYTSLMLLSNGSNWFIL